MKPITIVLVLILLCWNVVLQFSSHETKNNQEKMLVSSLVTLKDTLNQANNLVEDYYINKSDVSLYIATENLLDLSHMIRYYDYIDQPFSTYWKDLSIQLSDMAVTLSDARSSKDIEKMQQVQALIKGIIEDRDNLIEEEIN